MKKIFFMLQALVLSISSQAQFTKADLQATGLTCALCSNAVNKALEKVSFVQSVQADIKNASFVVLFKAGAEVDPDQLRNAVEDAGFSIGGLKLTGEFDNLPIAMGQPVKIGNDEFCFLDVSAQTLNGKKTIRIIDKRFVTAKEFKKTETATKAACQATTNDNGDSRLKIYHVTI